MTIHKKTHKNGVYVCYFKGAPERILRISSHVYENGKVQVTSYDSKLYCNLLPIVCQ
jgi:magnesium-transporting ATPase (P-type)